MKVINEKDVNGDIEGMRQATMQKLFDSAV